MTLHIHEQKIGKNTYRFEIGIRGDITVSDMAPSGVFEEVMLEVKPILHWNDSFSIATSDGVIGRFDRGVRTWYMVERPNSTRIELGEHDTLLQAVAAYLTVIEGACDFHNRNEQARAA